MPEQSSSRFRRHWLRLSVRGLIVLVLVIGCWLGWVVRSARIQRNAIAAINKAGGHIYYNWETDYIGNMSEAKPWWPKWLDSLLGPDYFGHVVQAHLSDGVSDTELVHVGNLTWLEVLSLRGGYPDYVESPVTDTGLANLERLTGLQDLDISETPITDAGLIHVKALAQLKTLRLRGTEITDAGLAHIRPLRRLQILDLHDKAITDAGLAHLKGMSNLTQLDLRETTVTDAGMTHLKGLTKLQALWLGDTQVTDSKMHDLKMAFPKSQIQR
jgi:internalin A